MQNPKSDKITESATVQEMEVIQAPSDNNGFFLSNMSLSRPASVFIIMILIFLMGFIAYRSMPREAAPEVEIPYLIVTIPYPGASPEDVDNQGFNIFRRCSRINCCNPHLLVINPGISLPL